MVLCARQYRPIPNPRIIPYVHDPGQAGKLFGQTHQHVYVVQVLKSV